MSVKNSRSSTVNYLDLFFHLYLIMTPRKTTTTRETAGTTIRNVLETFKIKYSLSKLLLEVSDSVE